MTDPKIGIVMNSNASTVRAVAGDVKPVDITDPVTKRPDITGPHGKAWLADIARGREIMARTPGIKIENDATLAVWIIEAPWVHPAWHSYVIHLVHLRPLPGQPPTTKFYLDGATHEMWLHALDPRGKRTALIETAIMDGATCCWLTPKQFAGQFIEITDKLALDRIAVAVQEVCDGKLSTDTDAQQQWIERFGNSMFEKEYR